METRQLGTSDLRVSVLTLGTLNWGGGGMFDRFGGLGLPDARRQLDAYMESGGNCLDTADAYSDGLSERIVGQVLKGRRDRLLVATKGGMPMRPGSDDRGLSSRHLIQACEASLQRMEIDTIDLYQMHVWDGKTPIYDIVDAIDTLVQSGKVRYVGVSNFAAWQVMLLLKEADLVDKTRIVSHQLHYSLHTRTVEHEILPVAVIEKLGTLVWGGLDGGRLTERFALGRTPPSHARHATYFREPPLYDRSRFNRILDTLIAIAAYRDVPAARCALAWLLGRPTITSVIIGAREEYQLLDNLAAVDLDLASEEIYQLDQVSDTPLPYPHWQFRNNAASLTGPADLMSVPRAPLDRPSSAS